MRSGLLSIEQLDEVDLFRHYRQIAVQAHPSLMGRRLLFETIRLMLSDQVYDVIATTQTRTAAAGVDTPDAVRESPPLVAFSDDMRERSQTLKSFLFRNLYRHPQVTETTARARQVVSDLFERYMDAPQELPEAHGLRRHLPRAVADYIAGMTDRFADSRRARAPLWRGAVSVTIQAGTDPRRLAALVVAVGVTCALHVGKLPVAIPVLTQSLGVTLVQAGFLLSMVQLAGMALGLLVGLMADKLGPRRVMIAGLLLLALGSMLGALAANVTMLLATRVVEGMGFLLAVLPAPGLLRQRVQHAPTLSRSLGWWGAYMPLGTALALLLGVPLLSAVGWRWAWVLLGLLSLLAAVGLARGVAPDAPARAAPLTPSDASRLGPRLRRTLQAPGPWLLALHFFCTRGNGWPSWDSCPRSTARRGTRARRWPCSAHWRRASTWRATSARAGGWRAVQGQVPCW